MSAFDLHTTCGVIPMSLFVSPIATRDARRCAQWLGTGGWILPCSRWHATHAQLVTVSFNSTQSHLEKPVTSTKHFE